MTMWHAKAPQSWPQTSWPSSSPACLFASCILQLLCVRIHSPHLTASHFHAFAFAFLLPATPPTLLSDPANSSCSSETHLKLVLLQEAFPTHQPHTPPHLRPAFCHAGRVLLFTSLTSWEHGAPQRWNVSLVPVSPAHRPSRQRQLMNE